MMFFFGFILAATLFAVLCPITRNSRGLPGWRGRLARLCHRRITRPAMGLINRIPRPRRHRPPDPFEALRVQTRLGAIADEIRELQFDGQIYARAARLEARSAAYDALLIEALELAGVPDEQEDEKNRSLRRMRREVELASRGWSW